MSEFVITPYERRHRQAISDLLFRSYRVHTHLDWHDAEDWLELPGVITRLAWQGVELAGVMAASEPLHNTAWIRIAALRDQPMPQSILQALWTELKQELLGLNIHTVALLLVRDWIARYIAPLGFRHVEEIITLRRDSEKLPKTSLPEVTLRTSNTADTAIITALDNAAFAPPWQLSPLEVRQALRIAAHSTVAMMQDQIVGYQITTTYRGTAHLARLAVLPALQGQRVGAALLDDMLRTFLRRGVQTVTVNTQATNYHSQHLYDRYEFYRNGYDLPVWQVRLSPTPHHAEN